MNHLDAFLKTALERRHVKLGPDLHYGEHDRYGRHVGLGPDGNVVHIYPNKIHIGGKDGMSIPLDPEQSKIAENLLARYLALANKKEGL